MNLDAVGVLRLDLKASLRMTRKLGKADARAQLVRSADAARHNLD
jgi:hypothetical protein